MDLIAYRTNRHGVVAEVKTGDGGFVFVSCGAFGGRPIEIDVRDFQMFANCIMDALEVMGDGNA